jgi:hypothetical protein
MKYFALFILLFTFNFGFSQFHVCETKELVMSYLKGKDFEFTEAVLSDTTSRISVLRDNDFQMIWVLDTNNIVTRQTLIPESENGVNEFVKWFNKDFVIISATEWRNYENGRIYTIKLKYIMREPIFSITLYQPTKD